MQSWSSPSLSSAPGVSGDFSRRRGRKIKRRMERSRLVQLVMFCLLSEWYSSGWWGFPSGQWRGDGHQGGVGDQAGLQEGVSWKVSVQGTRFIDVKIGNVILQYTEVLLISFLPPRLKGNSKPYFYIVLWKVAGYSSWQFVCFSLNMISMLSPWTWQPSNALSCQLWIWEGPLIPTSRRVGKSFLKIWIPLCQWDF